MSKFVALAFAWANTLFLAFKDETGLWMYMAFVIVWCAIFLDLSIREYISGGKIEVSIKEIEKKKETF